MPARDDLDQTRWHMMGVPVFESCSEEAIGSSENMSINRTFVCT